MDFWIIGVLGWLDFFLISWLVVWFACCGLGVLLCRCLVRGDGSPVDPSLVGGRFDVELGGLGTKFLGGCAYDPVSDVGDGH
jgi:hypothetical protein